jgi:hypothetical protein
MLDIFQNDAFSVTTLTDTINKLKFVPGRIGQLNLFSERGVTTTSVVLEERGGLIQLIGPTPRGGPGHTLPKPGRNARAIFVPHFEINDAVMAEEVQGVRAFGQETQVETVQGIVGERQALHTQSMAVTQEFSRMGALRGVVQYADDSELDLFTSFGVTAPADVFLDLSASSPGPGDLRRAVSGITRTVANSLDGVPFTGLMAFAGDDFYDDLVSHPEVRETYLGWQAAQELRQGFINPTAGGASGGTYGAFPFGGILWENYRGAIGDVPMVDPDEAHIFPLGVPGLFRTYYAPADYIETVNTVGQRLYGKQYEMPNGKGINLDTQMNALDICTRPAVLVRAFRGTA